VCSISGIVGGRRAGAVAAMVECQRHRAPDESGIYADDHIQLGMGRLKIIDMASPGLAPYQEDGLVLSYNGEIFNYVELRTELRAKGWKFRTASDSEVLLKAWRQWGVAMFDRLNGMFAFAIYDSKKRKLWLARDIAGEKPLYYCHRGRRLIFASEAKAIAEVMPVEERTNAFFDTFQHCFRTTLWKDVYEVPPAHYLAFDLPTGRASLVEYWDFQPRTIKAKTAAEELEELLGSAVALRLRRDVPTGLYYSKGIDSSLLSTYHDFEHQFYFDDTKNWRKDFFAQVGHVARHLDFPVGSLSAFPLFKLAQRASRTVKVVLSGEGADEIFGGYVRYLPIAREWELQRRYPSYQYIFNKYYPPYLDGFAKITARNGNVELARDAGLEVRDGVVVYERFAAVKPGVDAVGDLAEFFDPRPERGDCTETAGSNGTRLESGLAARDQVFELAQVVLLNLASSPIDAGVLNRVEVAVAVDKLALDVHRI